jgi:hypothetical protein
MWTCKQCKEEVEDSFEICWNCNSDKNGSLSTWQNISNDEENLAIENERLKEIAFNSSNSSLKKSGIYSAGTSLKKIVYAAILLILFTTIGIFISVSSKDPETIKNTYLFLGIVSLICNISILYNLYSAGDHLENS